MRLFADQLTLEKELAGLAVETGLQLGLVSSEAPLISNLDVWRNIALIYQYHRQASTKDARNFVMECLRRYGLENIAEARNPSLSENDRFCVKVLRAAMVANAVLVIDRPFIMLPHLKDTLYVYETLNKIDDLYIRCYILDYVHEKSRYGMTDDSET